MTDQMIEQDLQMRLFRQRTQPMLTQAVNHMLQEQGCPIEQLCVIVGAKDAESDHFLIDSYCLEDLQTTEGIEHAVAACLELFDEEDRAYCRGALERLAEMPRHPGVVNILHLLDSAAAGSHAHIEAAGPRFDFDDGDEVADPQTAVVRLLAATQESLFEELRRRATVDLVDPASVFVVVDGTDEDPKVAIFSSETEFRKQAGQDPSLLEERAFMGLLSMPFESGSVRVLFIIDGYYRTCRIQPPPDILATFVPGGSA